jgi:hypothetical protein
VTTTLVIVLATIFIFGGGTAPLLEIVLARDASLESRPVSAMPVSKTNEIGASLDMREARERDGEGLHAPLAKRASGFARFDKMWLIPIFRVSEQERAGEHARGLPMRLAAESDSPSTSARGSNRSRSPTWHNPQHAVEHATDYDD